MKPLPTTLTVGSYQIQVEARPAIEMERAEVEGRFHEPSALIELRDDMSLHSTQDTLLHEALHAVVQCHGLKTMLALGTLEEEQLVGGLAPALLSLLRANPDLVGYLLA